MAKVIVRYPETEEEPLQNIAAHPLLRRIYAHRGVYSHDDLRMELAHLLAWDGLRDIDKAAEILCTALQNKHRILVVGDYDVDGATSTALMVRVLKAYGAESVDYMIPNRFDSGYGLSPQLIDLLDDTQLPEVLLTVDNGITSHAGVDAARAKGMRVIVTDHHLPGKTLPAADAIVNPNQREDAFPSKHLAGVGVAFYVLMALRKYLRERGWFESSQRSEPNLAHYLDLVALGTVADMVHLDKNNRILVQQGVERIRKEKCCPGITALLRAAKRDGAYITTKDLGFAAGPRINAAGRMDDMAIGVECLLADDTTHARKMAAQLCALNQERKAVEKEMHQEALAILKEYQRRARETISDIPLGVCLMNESWHQGIVGILASRVKDYLQRPVIVFAAWDEHVLKGSARSVPDLHIREVLEEIAAEHPEMVVRFGGHAAAAGVNVRKSLYEQFVLVFDKKVRARLDQRDLREKVLSDGALDADMFTFDLAHTLRVAHPWGQGFPEPVFDNRFRLLDQRIIGRNHLQMTLELDNQILNAIAFNVDLESWPNHRCEFVHLAYRLNAKVFAGRKQLQLVVEHMEPL